MRKWSCTPADVDGDKNVAGRYAASAPLFFIQQSGIGNASPLLKDTGSRATHKEEMPDRPAWKLSIRLNYRLGMNEVKKKGKKKKRQEEQGNGEEERKKESSVHVHWCTLRDLGNGKWERGEEIMISKRYRVPYVPKDYYPLNLGLISEKREKKNAMIRIIAMIDDVWLAVEQRRFRNTWEAN